MSLRVWSVALCATAAVHAFALTNYLPDAAEILNNYRAANALGQGLNERHTNLSLAVTWTADSKHFIYRQENPNRKAEYRIATSANGESRIAFDHARLATALGKAASRTLDPTTLNFTITSLSDDQKTLIARIGDNSYEINLTSYEAKTAPGETTRRTNPAEPAIGARLREGKMEVRAAGSTEWKAISTVPDLVRMSRTPDSNQAFAFRLFPGDRRQVYLLKNAVNNTTRAALEERLYDQPGDKTDMFDVYLYDFEKQTEKKIDLEPIFGGGQPWAGPPQVQWWGENAVLSYTVRGYQEHRVVLINPKTGATRLLVGEKSPTFLDQGKMNSLRLLPNGRELIWASERTGWNHLYLYNRESQDLTQITKGDIVVRSVTHVDAEKRQIWFTANGFGDSGRVDPYFIHHCRVNMDGSGFVDLTPGNGTHTVQYSPDRLFYVDSHSRIDSLPVHELRRSRDGGLVKVLQRAEREGKGLEVEPFVAKGRDGKTDIWGIVIRPTHFKKGVRYPIIENIYAGPHDSFVPKNYRPMNGMHRLAELGFIVVQIDGMGTNNRGKKFHDVAWKNIVDAGFPDRIAWMQALAKKYPEADITRVGIYGTSAGGQNAAGALLFHSDFYDVAVSSCGCHDNRIDKLWWNEQWMGYPVGPHYEAQSNITHAKNLKGKLLLYVGEQDRNVPPESTIRFADALIKAGKNFDMLVIPGADHTDGGVYGERRRRDYFVRHLLGVEPPDWNTVSLTRN